MQPTQQERRVCADTICGVNVLDCIDNLVIYYTYRIDFGVCALVTVYMHLPLLAGFSHLMQLSSTSCRRIDLFRPQYEYINVTRL